MTEEKYGLIDKWLIHIKDIYHKYFDELEKHADGNDRQNRLCELNIIEQVANVCNSPVVLDAWQRKQDLTVHGWIYSIEDGALKDLHVSVDSAEQGKP